MASGINSTFRQVGIATGIAVLGAIFESVITSKLRRASREPRRPATLPSIGHAVAAGGAGAALAQVPLGAAGPSTEAVHAAFAGAMNDILLVAAIVAFTGAVLGLLLVRGSDFVSYGCLSRQPRRRRMSEPVESSL